MIIIGADWAPVPLLNHWNGNVYAYGLSVVYGGCGLTMTTTTATIHMCEDDDNVSISEFNCICLAYICGI